MLTSVRQDAVRYEKGRARRIDEISMNEQDELRLLKEQQLRLEKDLGVIALRLGRLERRLARPGVLKNDAALLPTSSASTSHDPLAQSRITDAREQPVAPAQPVSPPPILPAPPIILPSRSTPPGPRPAASPPEIRSATEQLVPSAPNHPRAIPETPPIAGVPERSLELRLGTYWAPRIGIVVLLTGLVFIGNLAYQNMGAWGKVALLYAASAFLLGAGAWWQRKAQDPLRNYAQVLFAGGLAAVYFTTYGAHHLESLRVIKSPFLDGLLLLGCAGFTVWAADRQKSELLAMFGIGLAYYSCVMTRVGFFTLYSNLVLTIAAVFFLVRNRWVTLSFGSLVASYAAYAFWRFFSGTQWHWASASEGLWSGTYFLASYWIAFTAGVFLSRDDKFADKNRGAFLTLNNGAFFTGFVLTMLQVNTGGFWRFCLIYGGVLLVLAEAISRVLPREQHPKNLYLTQGLLLVTIGLISKFAGLHLALILAAESAVLLLLAYQRRNVFLFSGAFIVAGLAIGWGIDGMRQEDPGGLYLAMGLGTLMLADTLLVDYLLRKESSAATSPAPGSAANPPLLEAAWKAMSGISSGRTDLAPDSPWTSSLPANMRPQVGYFAVLALVAWLVATGNNVSHDYFPLVLTVEGLLFTASIYLLRVREITLLSQGYVVIALFAWLIRWAEPQALPWWSPLLMTLLILVLSHWWQKQTVLVASVELRWGTQLLYALGIAALLGFWLGRVTSPPGWLAISGALAIGMTGYGVLTRAWMIGACGQLFVLVSVVQFAFQLLAGHPSWLAALGPMAALGLLSWSTLLWFRNRPGSDNRVRQPLLQLALGYRWAALPMSVAWVCEYIPTRERIWCLAVLGLIVFLLAGWKRNREALVYGAVYSAISLAMFWLTASKAETIYWANLMAILLVVLQQQIAKRRPGHYPLEATVHATIIFVTGLSVWWFGTRCVLEQASSSYLTASWSLLALMFFASGIVLRERMYRWLGLALLACALGRIVLFDVWKFETLYRILSFMALGIVLLVLGFVYSRYQDKIRQWL
jgi:uncharacterized membrane protein